MRFGPIPVGEAEGAVLAHSLAGEGLRLKKGRVLSGSDVAALAFRSVPDGNEYAAVERLSPRGDLREAAAHIFAALRRLDALGVKRIVAELLPEQGLGRAVNDRLRRAAAR